MKRRVAHDAGFTLIEVLMATLLMAIILGALATVTAQWLPNWNRGMARVQRLEKLALGLDRIAADLAVAEMLSQGGSAKTPLFEGNELSLSFVRGAVRPNAAPGLEIVRYSEQADQDGLALICERATFAPGLPVRFGDRVVLLRAPFRVSFAYAGADMNWRPNWRDQPLLPRRVRITVRDAGGAVLNVSTVAQVHVDLPPDCVRATSVAACLVKRPRGDLAETQL